MTHYLVGTVAVILIGATLTVVALVVQTCRDYSPGCFHE